MRVNDFVRFIRARHDIFHARTRLKPKPWTKDTILQSYRFCNVYRELDKVTQWISTNWREPLSKSSDLWFWMLVARLVNNPDTLALIGYKRNGWRWDAERFVGKMRDQMRDGRKAWGGAYIVSTNGVQMEKSSYIAEHVLTPAWASRASIQPKKGDLLDDFCDRLLTLNGVQGFIAGQVIADAKYADPHLLVANDWKTFAISGPGSRRGLNRVMERDHETRWNEKEWKDCLLTLRVKTNAKLDVVNKKENERGRPRPYPELHAQDVQNCLCEFDKYERVRLGQGKPRSTYPGI